jgi:putative transposase
MCCGHRAVALENLALRQQLAVFKRTVQRPPLRPRDRLFWVLLAHAWRNWRSAVIVVQPETVVGWHRQWLRRRWAHRSTSGRPGRPRTTTAIRTLVDQMGAANPLWGAPRIHGELSKLGIDVSERTVSRLLRRRDRPPSQTWRTFLANHVTSLVSMDFFTVPTLTGRVLFVLVLLAHHRRRIVHLASPNIPPPHGRRNRSSRPFRTTPRRGGSCGIATQSTGKRSGAVSPAWASRRSSPVPQVLGKTRMRRD